MVVIREDVAVRLADLRAMKPQHEMGCILAWDGQEGVSCRCPLQDLTETHLHPLHCEHKIFAHVMPFENSFITIIGQCTFSTSS